MNNAIIEKLSYNELQTFLTQYHQRLHSVENFPPLNPNKAMHIAAKSMGLKNAHVLKDRMPEPAQTGYDNTQSGNAVWEDDLIQFTRLVAEMSMAAESENISLDDVLESMDLELPELYELFGRAERAFEKIKAGEVQQKTPETPAIDSVIMLVFNEKADSSGGSETYTDMEVVKNWEAAKEMIASRVSDKGLARADDGRTDELLSVNCVTVPDEDDEVDLGDAEAVLDWIIENNDVHDLADYLEYLDFDLTTVSMKEKFL